MTHVMTERQWSKGRPFGGHGFRTRREGFNQAKRTWKCCQCRAEYQAKTKVCNDPEFGCGSKELWYFGSRHELRLANMRLGQLDRGEIRDLEFQPAYPILTVNVQTGDVVNTKRAYKADCKYVRVDTGETVVEDAKPKSADADDPLFKLKRAIIEASYGFEIQLVREL